MSSICTYDMLCIYIHRFVDIHNNHSIRKQPKQDDHLSTGKPFEMYFYPESEINYARSVDQNMLEYLESEVEGYQLDEFLTLETINLFEYCLLKGGFPIGYTYQDNHEQV